MMPRTKQVKPKYIPTEWNQKNLSSVKQKRKKIITPEDPDYLTSGTNWIGNVKYVYPGGGDYPGLFYHGKRGMAHENVRKSHDKAIKLDKRIVKMKKSNGFSKTGKSTKPKISKKLAKNPFKAIKQSQTTKAKSINNNNTK